MIFFLEWLYMPDDCKLTPALGLISGADGIIFATNYEWPVARDFTRVRKGE
jgi:hypothetical protein